MKTPFSVLMSVYHKENPLFLEEAVKSVFQQSLLPDEVIIVEDGVLTDELYTALGNLEGRYPEIKRIKLSYNEGLGRALNEGLKYCSHDIVARMDTDDIALPDRFLKQLEIIQQYPDAEIVSSWIDEFIDSPDNIISTRKLPQFPYQIYQYAKSRCPVNHPCVVFKKSAVLFAGGYQHFPLFEDYYLWIRLLMNGAKFYNIQESLLLFRTSSDLYKRRGGLKHGINEIKFQYQIKKIGFISWWKFTQNIVIRFIVRVLPNSTRKIIYTHFLRNNT